MKKRTPRETTGGRLLQRSDERGCPGAVPSCLWALCVFCKPEAKRVQNRSWEERWKRCREPQLRRRELLLCAGENGLPHELRRAAGPGPCSRARTRFQEKVLREVSSLARALPPFAAARSKRDRPHPLLHATASTRFGMGHGRNDLSSFPYGRAQPRLRGLRRARHCPSRPDQAPLSPQRVSGIPIARPVSGASIFLHASSQGLRLARRTQCRVATWSPTRRADTDIPLSSARTWPTWARRGTQAGTTALGG